MIVPPPPSLESYRAGHTLVAGLGFSTILPEIDFETYSEAGYIWNDATDRWEKPPGAQNNANGIEIVGAANYTQHPSAEILSVAYDLKDGRGRRRWKPGDAEPLDLFLHIESGCLLEAWNAAFERWCFVNLAGPRYGWPVPDAKQWRCAMAKARAHALPGALGPSAQVLGLAHQKDSDGTRLLNKFSRPRQPTKNDRRRRILPAEDPVDAKRLYDYNEDDIAAEAEHSSLTPDLSADEQDFWFADQDINFRGVAVDAKAIDDCIAIIEQAYAQYNAELRRITNGAVTEASQLPSLKVWLGTVGVFVGSLREEDLDELLKREGMNPLAKRALEIRSLIGSASVKKLFAMRNQKTLANRLHDLFSFHAARTGRATGNGPQPQNLPKAGPDVRKCSQCSHWFGAHTYQCPWCLAVMAPGSRKYEWSAECHDDAFVVIATRSLHCVEMFFGDALLLIAGSLRGLFVAEPGKDLIASDYAAIEAVVLAAMAGEQWRLQVFADKRDIYLASAAKITGNTLEFYEQYKETTKSHHPHRQPYGKVAELSSGYQGWIGAWKQFGADEYFSDDEIKAHILAWRKASPWIVELWGGQHRGLPWNPDYQAEYYGLEGAAIQAVLNPGVEFSYCAPHPFARAITYVVKQNVLYCRLPSGRLLTYHRPQLQTSSRNSDELALSFEGWNTNPKMGPYGWITMYTYGGKLTENVVQAIARDILAYAIVRLIRAGYPVVLHVHDEIVAEILRNFGSLEEFERIMATLPDWCTGWPLRAVGGWRGHRYRKD